MQFQWTTALKKIVALVARWRIIQGGARAGKTIAILFCLIDLAQSNNGLIISVVSETLPHLKRGAMRDFIAIMTARRYFDPKAWNRTDFIYTFPNGSIIEFFSADSPAKVRGPARDVLFVNECNNVLAESVRQLAMRTRRAIYLDFNPVHEFYVHEDHIHRPNAQFLKLTYKDNEALDQAIVDEIELLKHTNPNLWRIYGLGEIGINEGQIYTNWELIDAVPEDARLLRHGLDFGFTNDPSALLDVHQWNGGFVLNEVLHAHGLHNRVIANAIRESEGLPVLEPDNRFYGWTKVLTIADSAEPKSIDEIKNYGVMIEPSVKGGDSVDWRIQLMQRQKFWITKDSLNVVKDFRNFTWKVDSSGKPLNVPNKEFKHSPDAAGYAIADILGKPDLTKGVVRVGSDRSAIHRRPNSLSSRHMERHR